ncbi:MAG: hypothetical protein IKM39_00525 [Clostridia bacterium]|nr:hypothetical protein [Clostridia bacterium]
MNVKPKHLKAFWDKKAILFVSLLVIFAVAVGTTTAWLTSNDGPASYQFEGTFVKAVVNGENHSSSYPGTADPPNTLTGVKNMVIENHGNVAGYVRAEIAFVFIKDGTESNPIPEVHSSKPVENTHYTIRYNNEKWNQGIDGYWYYTESISAKGGNVPGKTDNLVDDCGRKSNSTIPNGYHLSWTLVANIIQAEPGSDWQTAWAKAEGAPKTQSKPTRAE